MLFGFVHSKVAALFGVFNTIVKSIILLPALFAEVIPK
jgi:hypothetical protein